MASNPDEMAAAVRQHYQDAQSIETVAAITSDLGEETRGYQIGYSYQKQEEGSSAVMTVLEPESIAGITAEVSGDSFTFSYGETELETAMPDRKGLTPADVTTYLLRDLMQETPKQVWKEENLLALRYEQQTEEGTVMKEVYLNPQTDALSEARIYQNGKQCLRCTFSACTLDGK